jgi:periplasmic copper chaperone A
MIALLFASTLLAQVTVSNSSIRLVPPVSQNSVGLMDIRNASKTDLRLVRVESDISKRVELHLMKKVDGYMTMRPVPHVELRKGQVTKLDGTYHVMFLGLKRPLKEYEKHPLTLVLSNGEKIQTEAQVLKHE